MIPQELIEAKVAEDGVRVTSFSGVIALSKHVQSMGMFAEAERHLGWVKESRRGKRACFGAPPLFVQEKGRGESVSACGIRKYLSIVNYKCTSLD